MILLIDNYDSFTYNLAHLIGGLGEAVDVRRNDAISATAATGAEYEAIVLSPGPCTPNEAGVCLELIAAAAKAQKPVFGVCLGMQAIAQSFGGEIVRARRLMHGKTCGVVHDGKDVFENLPSPFTAARYHSLVADRSSLPAALEITAAADDDGEIMGLAHKTLPIAGVQFHPESIATEHGGALLANFLREARA